MAPSVAFAEAAPGLGIFVPGLVLVTVCSVLLAEGLGTLQEMVFLAFLGALLADHCGFYLGVWSGPSLRSARWARRHADRIARAENLVRRFGPWAIVIGRFIPAIRSIVPLAVGMAGLPRWKYSLIDGATCAGWAAGLAAILSGVAMVVD